jgi:hypothetical protein
MDHKDFDGTNTYPSPSAYTPHSVVAVVVVPVKYFAIHTTTRNIHKLYATNNY